MKRFLILIALLLAPLAPAQAYWEYGHETVAKIAQANMSAKARANMQRLLRAAPMLGTPKCAMRNIGDVSVWADCIKGDRVRWGYTNSWHYQNVDICKPFDLKSACADGNCVSAQIDRNFALLSNKALPAHVRLEALAFLVHFVGDIHQPLHAGDHADRGGNDLKTTYGVMPGYNLHSVGMGCWLIARCQRRQLSSGHLRPQKKRLWTKAMCVCGVKKIGRYPKTSPIRAPSMVTLVAQNQRPPLLSTKLM